MEASVKAVLQEARELDTNLHGHSTIAEVVVADKRGLSIEAQGTVVSQTQTPGFLTALAALASSLEPGREQPVILVESHQLNYLIKKEDTVTVAVIQHHTE